MKNFFRFFIYILFIFNYISYVNSQRSNFVMNGLTDADWDEYVKQVNAYGLDEYLSIYQKYFDAFYAD